MLLGQDFRRSDQGPLVPGGDHLEQRDESDDGLARAHVSLQEALHRNFARQVRPDLSRGVALGLRELEGQGPSEALE